MKGGHCEVLGWLVGGFGLLLGGLRAGLWVDYGLLLAWFREGLGVAMGRLGVPLGGLVGGCGRRIVQKSAKKM